MNAAELYQGMRLVVARAPSAAVREALLPLLQGATSAALRYEWVVDWKAFDQLVHTLGVELGDGEEWVRLSLTTP